jgi:hypothetical protein
MSAMTFRILLVGCLLGVSCVSSSEAVDATFTWDPPINNMDGSPLEDLAGYRIYYGPASHVYSTTVDVGFATTATIANFAQGTTVFFTVSAYTSNGNVSLLNGELSWTAPAAQPPPFDITQVSKDGIPPMVSIAMERGGLKLGIWGTVGADVSVQVTTNLSTPLAWALMKNMTLTNAAPSLDGTPPPVPQNALEAAFIPAIEWFALSVSTSYPSQFFRVAMPYDYAVLADKVLRSKGYQTRLIVVRLPGETLHDVCYVTADKAYIDCSDDRFILALNYSGETIREIADDYSGYVSMNWTSASEFVYDNGVRLLGSTVVKTDSPASDPPLASTQT